MKDQDLYAKNKHFWLASSGAINFSYLKKIIKMKQMKNNNNFYIVIFLAWLYIYLILILCSPRNQPDDLSMFVGGKALTPFSYS